MIDTKQINDRYHVGREKPGGKVYVTVLNNAHIASYSGLTRTLEWYQAVSPEDQIIIETYLRHNY